MLDEPYVEPDHSQSLNITFQPRQAFVGTIVDSNDENVTIDWSTSDEQAVIPIGDSPVLSRLADLSAGTPVVVTIDGPKEEHNVVSFLQLNTVSHEEQFALV